MRQSVEMTDVAALMRGTEEDIARVQTLAMIDTTEDVKSDLREQVVAAGLGVKLANTIRGVTYPIGTSSLDPAGWVDHADVDLHLVFAGAGLVEGVVN